MIAKHNLQLVQNILKIQTTRSLGTSGRLLNNQPVKPPVTKQSQSAAPQQNINVPGLTSAVLTANEPVGPGAAKSGEYKVPEYFNYGTFSYFEAEVEMKNFRLPQPSAVKK